MLEVENLDVFIGKKKIVQDVSFQVNKGEIIGLIGPNGAGKTTIMKAILGLNHFSGEVNLDGDYISETNHKGLQKVGALIEHPAIYPFMTGYQNLNLYSKNNGDLEEVVSLLQMNHYINKRAKDYSLGMKQKLGIALSLLNNPKLVILDEPMNGLDIESTILVRNIIKKYAEKGSSFLISSHILSELQKVMTNVILITGGKMIVNKPIDDFYQLSYQNFKLFSEDNEKTKEILAKENIPFSIAENYLIIDRDYLYVIQDLLSANHIHMNELVPIGDTFEDLVVHLLEEGKENDHEK